jgi:hypothetical protein
MFRAVAALAAFSVFTLAACGGGSYYQRYRASHPDWIPAFPDPESDLEQTLASIHQPGEGRAQVLVRKLEIYQTNAEPWRPIRFDAIESGATPSSPEHDYAVIATFSCVASLDLEVYRGEKVGFYLLSKNKLVAFDHYVFIETCAVNNQFQPAQGDAIPTERKVWERIETSYPRSMFHAAQYYQKGLAYAEVGRLDDAKRMLAEGDHGVDVAEDRNLEFESPGVPIHITDQQDRAALRRRLAERIVALEKVKQGSN